MVYVKRLSVDHNSVTIRASNYDRIGKVNNDKEDRRQAYDSKSEVHDNLENG